MVQTVAGPDNEMAIRRSVEDIVAAFNAHDAGRVVRGYLDCADLVTTQGQHLRDRDEIRERLEAVFSRPDCSLRQRLLDVTVRFVRDDVALVHVMTELSGFQTPDGRPRPPHRELSLRVYVREEGAWRVSAFHNTVIAAS